MVRSLIHDVASYPRQGHALDSLIFLYFPPTAMAGVTVVIVHYKGDCLALDIISPRSAAPDSPVVYCLQRRGAPGHMQAMTPSSAWPLSQLRSWAADHDVPTRELTAAGWQAFVAADSGGPSLHWATHAACDFCQLPRYPLPPSPSF